VVEDSLDPGPRPRRALHGLRAASLPGARSDGALSAAAGPTARPTAAPGAECADERRLRDTRRRGSRGVERLGAVLPGGHGARRGASGSPRGPARGGDLPGSRPAAELRPFLFAASAARLPDRLRSFGLGAGHRYRLRVAPPARLR